MALARRQPDSGDAMSLVIEGVGGNPALRAWATRRMEAVAARLRVAPLSARLAFTDENGPKGGVGIRCALTLTLPRQPTLHAEQVAETQRLAFDGAMVGLEHQLARQRGQAREERRRPKKYYIAKRLLSASEEGR